MLYIPQRRIQYPVFHSYLETWTSYFSVVVRVSGQDIMQGISRKIIFQREKYFKRKGGSGQTYPKYPNPRALFNISFLFYSYSDSPILRKNPELTLFCWFLLGSRFRAWPSMMMKAQNYVKWGMIIVSATAFRLKEWSLFFPWVMHDHFYFKKEWKNWYYVYIFIFTLCTITEKGYWNGLFLYRIVCKN